MPKLNLSAANATKGGGGSRFSAQEGWWKVMRCYSTVYEFPQSDEAKAKREKPNKACMVMLELMKADPKTYEVMDEEDEPIVERLGFGAKNTLDEIRPGNMATADAADAEDLGKEDGVEGNSIYFDEGKTIEVRDNTTWAIFVGSAEKHGFDASKTASGYLPYFEGMVFEVERVKAFKSPNASEKTKDKWAKYGDPTNLAVKEIAVFGYAQKKVANKPAKSATAKSNGVAAKMDSSIVVTALQEIAKANSGKSIKRARLQADVYTYLMRKTQLDKANRDTLLAETIKSDDWLLEIGPDNGVIVDFDAGTVEFTA